MVLGIGGKRGGKSFVLSALFSVTLPSEDEPFGPLLWHIICAMKRAIALGMLCLCPLLQGCVGFVVAKQDTQVINNPVIASQADYENPAETREQARKRMAIADPAEATNRVTWEVYTPAWLQTHWGQPKHIRHADEVQVWTYHFGPIWEGIMPCLIVPIPLVLPVGEKKIGFTFHDGHVVSVSVTRPSTGGIFWPKKM